MTTTTTKTRKAKSTTPAVPTNVSKLTEVLSIREKAKGLYKLADELESQLLDAFPPNQPIILPTGDVVTLVDNFATKNVVFKAGSFRRFEFKVVKGGRAE